MMLLNKDDMLRAQFNIKKKPAESIVKRGYSFAIPMPAVGESLIMTRSKHPDSFEELMVEFNRLLNKGFFTITYIQSSETFRWAKFLCSTKDDPRDNISYMDAFITASAITDANCNTLYTVDNTLLLDLGSLDDVNDWRQEKGMGELKVKSIFDVLVN